MKKLLICISAVLYASSAWAQSFEGYINYSFKMKGMGENQEMAAAAAFLPTDFSYFVKGDMAKMKIKGGMMAQMMGTMLIDAAKKKVYILNEDQKTAYVANPDQLGDGAGERKPESIQVKEIQEYQTIAGYKCKKHLVTVNDPAGKTEQVLWVTDKLVVKNTGIFSNMGSGAVITDKIKGMALKVELKTNGMDVVMEATEVRVEQYKDEFFEVPSGYKVQDFNPASMFGGMLGE